LRGDEDTVRQADKVKMHPNIGITTVQVLWTLNFAALMVLLVVLLGRERSRRFKWFTVSIVLLAFRLLVSKLLFGKMAPVSFYEIFIPLADLSAVVGLVVLVELARKAFVGLGRRAWLLGTLLVLAVGGVVLAEWGTWPAWKTLSAATTLAVLGLMQTASQKLEMLTNVVAVELGVLVLLFGRRFKAGWRSHTQAIVIGLSTAALAQMLRDGIWQLIAMKAAPQTQAAYEHLIGIREKLSNGSEFVFLAVVVWWIATLWIDEPGAGTAVEEKAPNPEYLLQDDSAVASETQTVPGDGTQPVDPESKHATDPESE
jgi:hypothetical protein